MKKYAFIFIFTLIAVGAVDAQPPKEFLDTTAKTKEVATKYFDLYMAMDWDRLETMLHLDSSFQDPTAALIFSGEKESGKAAMMKKFREGYASLTSMKAKLSRTFFSSSVGVFELDLTFGFRNRQKGITTITMPLVVVITVRDGKVIEHRDFGDYTEYLKQLKAAQAQQTAN